MLSLFISTYNDLVTVALIKDGEELSNNNQHSNKSHSVILLPLIKKMLDENELDVNELNEIILVNGPGSFTGIRLGITVAKTLAYTLNIPIKTITSIEAVAASTDSENKIITIDDNKGKYLGLFNNNKLVELIYLKENLANEYINNHNLPIYNSDIALDIKRIYTYSKAINPIQAHSVKAIYIKEIEALNGK